MSALFKALIAALMRFPNTLDNTLAACEVISRVGRKAAENWEAELDREAQKLASQSQP